LACLVSCYEGARMSRRIAHRPRYQSMRQLAQPQFSSQYGFFLSRARWSYHQQKPRYEKRKLGYRLTLIPIQHPLMHISMLLKR
jgi:hypothetical protein